MLLKFTFKTYVVFFAEKIFEEKESNKEEEEEPPLSISCRDFQEIVLYRKNVLVIDVRSREDFDNSRISRLKSVINFPEDDIRLSIGYVVVCVHVGCLLYTSRCV